MPFIRLFLILPFAFTFSPSFAQISPECGPLGICDIITEQLSSVVDVNAYSVHGLTQINKSFDGQILADGDDGLVSFETSNGSINGLGFNELSSKLSAFFISRDNPEEDGKETVFHESSLALYEANGNKSQEYNIYLEYQEKYNKAQSDLDAAQTRAAKKFLDDEFRAVEAEWVALGYKYEIEELLREETQANFTDPRWIAGEIETIFSNLDASVISRSFLNQLESDAWNRLSREYPLEQAPVIEIGSSSKRIKRASFDLSEFPTISVPIIPEYATDFLISYFDRNACDPDDVVCQEIEELLGNVTIVRQVVLVKNLRVWLHDHTTESEYPSTDSLTFISDQYFEAAGPFLYMTKRGEFGL